jgi:hypothetical protein
MGLVLTGIVLSTLDSDLGQLPKAPSDDLVSLGTVNDVRDSERNGATNIARNNSLTRNHEIKSQGSLFDAKR